MNLLVTTLPGLEEIAIQEVGEITGKRARKEHRGMIRLEGKEEDIFKLNYQGKSLHRVMLLLKEGDFSSLKDVYRETKEIEFVRYIHPGQKFAARANRLGKHDFTSLDVEREVGQAVIDSYKGARPGVDLESPDVMVRSEIRGNHFWTGLDTTGPRSLHKRGYRVSGHPAPLKPTIAYSLVRLSGWGEGKKLIDPMCGSGTIPIEASLYGRKVPNWFREDYHFWNLPFLDRERFFQLRKEQDEKVQTKSFDIYGCDLFKKHVRIAEEMGRKTGANVKFFQGDATKINLDYDVIIVNPPYGLRVGGKRKIARLYEDFFDNLMGHSWRKLVILTASPEYVPKKKLERRIDIIYGNLPASILIFDPQQDKMSFRCAFGQTMPQG